MQDPHKRYKIRRILNGKVFDETLHVTETIFRNHAREAFDNINDARLALAYFADYQLSSMLVRSARTKLG